MRCPDWQIASEHRSGAGLPPADSPAGRWLNDDVTELGNYVYRLDDDCLLEGRHIAAYAVGATHTLWRSCVTHIDDWSLVVGLTNADGGDYTLTMRESYERMRWWLDAQYLRGRLWLVR